MVVKQPVVLVVDDDPATCDMLAELLQTEGYRVECAVDGRSGLDRALAGEVGLMLLDLSLPDFDGLELLQRVREREDQRVPVIALTALSSIMEGYVLAMGADAFLPKPFDLDELLDRVRYCLAQPVRGAI